MAWLPGASGPSSAARSTCGLLWAPPGSGVCSVFIQEVLGRLGLPGDVDMRAVSCMQRTQLWETAAQGYPLGRAQSEPLSGLQGMSTLLFFNELNPFLALSF